MHHRKLDISCTGWKIDNQKIKLRPENIIEKLFDHSCQPRPAKYNRLLRIQNKSDRHQRYLMSQKRNQQLPSVNFLDPGSFVFQPKHSRNRRDRKSTRLNSSHVAISYAVFCLEKKTQIRIPKYYTQVVFAQFTYVKFPR